MTKDHTVLENIFPNLDSLKIESVFDLIKTETESFMVQPSNFTFNNTKYYFSARVLTLIIKNGSHDMDKEEAVFEQLPNFKRPQEVEFHNIKDLH